jgi:hypothetical protein
MNVTISKNKENGLMRLRKLGYAPYQNRQGVDSFVRRLQGNEFPRFHLYIQEDSENVLNCSLHIDQTTRTHAKGNAHKGEYNSPVVTEEKKRLEKS